MRCYRRNNEPYYSITDDRKYLFSKGRKRWNKRRFVGGWRMSGDGFAHILSWQVKYKPRLKA